MTNHTLTFRLHDATGVTERPVRIDKVVIAGWTGRDEHALLEHIAELEALGVAAPKSVPMFYRVDAHLLTQDTEIQVVGSESSGEIEAVIIKDNGELFIGVGSDHTDRALETVGITLSKQVCAKPVSTELWRWSEVAEHWDKVEYASHIPETAEPYQKGTAAGLRRPDELLALYEAREGTVPDGTAMFCGTFAANGGIRFAPHMALVLHDPVMDRTIHHSYGVTVLPIAEA
jgi:hypothetical protein